VGGQTLELQVEQFDSALIPHSWGFKGVHLALNDGACCLSLEEASVARVGVGADDVVGLLGTEFSEEADMLCNLLDIKVKAQGFSVAFDPALLQDISHSHASLGVAHDVLNSVHKLVSRLQALPSLNSLSLSQCGPGYAMPPTPPTPDLLLILSDVQLRIEVRVVACCAPPVVGCFL
jgi:hypothetical protein